MKTSTDPRHKRRQSIIQELFKVDFHTQSTKPEIEKILKKKDQLDQQIQIAAPEFPIEKINKIDLAILRLAVYELLIEKTEPANVIIDEAIELAKEFANETSPAFINGALGNILKNEHIT